MDININQRNRVNDDRQVTLERVMRSRFMSVEQRENLREDPLIAQMIPIDQHYNISINQARNECNWDYLKGLASNPNLHLMPPTAQILLSQVNNLKFKCL